MHRRSWARAFRIDPNSNEYLVAKIGFDTAENEPCKVCPLKVSQSPRYVDTLAAYGCFIFILTFAKNSTQVRFWRAVEHLPYDAALVAALFRDRLASRALLVVATGYRDLPAEGLRLCGPGSPTGAVFAEVWSNSELGRICVLPF